MRDLKRSSAANKMIYMVSSADMSQGLPGLTLAITASKDGGAFTPIAPIVTDLGNGWYNLALTTAHTNTLGDFALHVDGGPTAAVSDVLWSVVGYDPYSATNLGLTNLDTNVASVPSSTWEEPAAGHLNAGTLGLTVSQTKADTTTIYTNLNLAAAVLDTLIKYEKNRTKIDKALFTLTVYDDNGVTPLKVFDLKDPYGAPSVLDIVERLPRP